MKFYILLIAIGVITTRCSVSYDKRMFNDINKTNKKISPKEILNDNKEVLLNLSPILVQIPSIVITNSNEEVLSTISPMLGSIVSGIENDEELDCKTRSLSNMDTLMSPVFPRKIDICDMESICEYSATPALSIDDISLCGYLRKRRLSSKSLPSLRHKYARYDFLKNNNINDDTLIKLNKHKIHPNFLPKHNMQNDNYNTDLEGKENISHENYRFNSLAGISDNTMDENDLDFNLYDYRDNGQSFCNNKILKKGHYFPESINLLENNKKQTNKSMSISLSAEDRIDNLEYYLYKQFKTIIPILQSMSNNLETMPNSPNDRSMQSNFSNYVDSDNVISNFYNPQQKEMKDIDNTKREIHLLKKQNQDLKEGLTKKANINREFEKKYEDLKVTANLYKAKHTKYKKKLKESYSVNKSLKQQMTKYESAYLDIDDMKYVNNTNKKPSIGKNTENLLYEKDAIIKELKSNMDNMAKQNQISQKKIKRLAVLDRFRWYNTIQKYKSLEMHTEQIQDFSFNMYSDFLISGGSDKMVVIWDINKGNMRRKDAIVHLNESVQSLDFSPMQENIFLSSEIDGCVNLWDLNKISGRHTFVNKNNSDNGPIMGAKFNIYNKIIGIGFRNSIELWDSTSNKLIYRFENKEGFSNTLCFGNKGLHVTANGINFIPIYDIKRYNKPYLIIKEQNTCISTIDYHTRGTTLVTCDFENEIKVWDTEKRKKIRSFKKSSSFGKKIALSPDRHTIAIGIEDRAIELFNTFPFEYELKKTMKVHDMAVVNVKFSPCNSYIATCSKYSNTHFKSSPKNRNLKLWTTVP